MTLFTVTFAGGGHESFPVRLPPGAEGDAVVHAVKAMSKRMFPNKEVVRIVATRTEMVVWPL